MSAATLLYVADPMCSWCHGFAGELAVIEAALPPGVGLQLVTGGLAPDSDAPMDATTRARVQDAWRAVAAATGARFEFAFWERCAPRRSTWPACRAVHAAELLRPGAGRALFERIQRAFYTEARDPSDRGELLALAGALAPPLDRAELERALDGPAVRARFEADLALARAHGVTGFPTLVLAREDGRAAVLARGYERAPAVLERLRAALD